MSFPVIVYIQQYRKLYEDSVGLHLCDFSVIFYHTVLQPRLQQVTSAIWWNHYSGTNVALQVCSLSLFVAIYAQTRCNQSILNRTDSLRDFHRNRENACF